MTGPHPPKTAVALQYDGAAAPRLTAKGQGALADKIIEVAEQNGVMVEENAALAVALSTIELEQEIPAELYQAVAEVIAFVMGVADKGR